MAEPTNGAAASPEPENVRPEKSRLRTWTRRAFIGAGAAAGGGLVVGLGAVAFAPNRLKYLPEGAPENGDARLTTWIRISPDNRVTALIPHCEMGQGAITGLGMLLAEELDADWSLVTVEQAPAEDVYANGYVFNAYFQELGVSVPRVMERLLDFSAFKMAEFFGMQTTGGSTSTRGTGQFGMRLAGATARAMLLAAASEHFGLPEEELSTRDSRVTHAASGRSATYGDLAGHAATMRMPRRPTLKSREEYRIVGTPQPRPDIPSKVVGEARYGIDVVVPDMLYAAIRRAPIPGGMLESVDPTPARSMPGVRDVVQLPDAVAVVADGYWYAQQALNALSPRFTDAGKGNVGTESLYRAHVSAINAEMPEPREIEGARYIVADYTVPYLHHMTMEPMCATVRLAGGVCEIWAGTQDPLSSRGVAAEAAGLDREAVILHNQHLGGGFGRRLPGTYDYIEQAVHVARATSPRPVKLVWSREEDVQHGYYRPLVAARLRAALDAQGRPLVWTSRFTGGRTDTFAARPRYGIPDFDVRAVAPPAHLRTGAWRSVASSQHGFFVESFVDELAVAAGRDPVEYRLALLEDEPRMHAVLARVAEMSGWGTHAPPDRARGVAIVESFGSIVAQVAEVGLEADGRIRVHRVHAAVDCGLVVNPQQAEAQVQGGIIFGLSAALLQEITVRGGAVEQRNFPDYPSLRLAEAPEVHVAFVDSGGPMGGLGEPGVPPIAPAVANAVYALTGQRLRRLPLRMS